MVLSINITLTIHFNSSFFIRCEMVKKFSPTHRLDLLVTTIPGQIEPGNSGNEELLHIPQSSRNGTLPSDAV